MQKKLFIANHSLVVIFILLLCSCGGKVADEPFTENSKLKRAIQNFNQLQDNGKGKIAINYFNSETANLKNLNPLDLWLIYWNKGKYHLHYEQDVIKADLYADSAETMLLQLKNIYPDEHVKTFYFRGDLLLAQKRYNEAFKQYYDGREYAFKNLEPCKLSNYTSQLGNVKFKQEQLPDAITYYKQALKESQNCEGDTSFEYSFVYPQSKMNTVAMMYEIMSTPDSAIHYYQQALSFIETAKATNQKDSIFVQRAYGVVTGNLGGAYKMKGNYKDAERLFLESIAINDRPGYEYQDAMTVKIKLADLYLKTNRASLCYTLLNNLFNSLTSADVENSQRNNLLLSYHRLLKIYYDKVGNISDAYTAQTKFYALKDSLSSVNKGLKVADMEMAFELNEQKYKASMLEKEGEVKTAYLVTFGLLVVGAIFSILFFWRDMKKSRSYIDKLRKLNYQNQQTLAALEQSREDNDKILRIVAHDLRNPLSGITGVVALMMEEDGFSEETKEELALIKATADHSLSLVNELLQINFNMNDLEMNNVDMDELVQYCAELLKHKAEAKGQKIVAKSIPVTIIANREKIWRVLSNLIGNAIKFSPNDSIIFIELQQGDEHAVLLTVKDQGIGIPPGMGDHLFDIFTPAKRAGTAGEESFGMGLSICKQIIEAHGGKIWFESEIGQGTTFYFTLPILARSSVKE